MSKKKILITGGAGFIGSNFANFHKKEYQIVVLDNLFLGDKENLDIHENITFIEGDACSPEDLNKCLDVFGGSVDFVVHFAGTSSQPMFNGDGFAWGYTNAISSFVHTLEWARKNGVCIDFFVICKQPSSVNRNATGYTSKSLCGNKACV